MRTLIITATALASLATAAPAFADHNRGASYGHNQNYGGVDPRCLSERRTSRNVGGFLGALGGASAGRALAAAAVRPEGVILGTVVGAVIGSSVGNAAVDCSPRATYTQQGGRSYGATGHHAPRPVYYGHNQGGYNQAPVYQPPVYQAPVHNAPVYQAPVYQAPVNHAPVYQQPVYQQPVYQQPVYQEPVQHSYQVVGGGEDWYQPSPQSYYGQERRGPLVAAPAPYPRPDYVPHDSYIGSQQQAETVVVTQTYHAGPAYAPAPQYAPHHGQVMVAPAGAPCGYQVCR